MAPTPPITPPITPALTNAQTISKYLAAILTGGPIGWFGGELISSLFEGQQLPDVVNIALVILVIIVIGNFLGDRLNKMRSHSARWWLLIAVGAVPIGALIIYMLMTK